MQLYRFSPITTAKELLEAVEFLHFACFQLCKQSIGHYLPIAGNVGIFCHYDNEYNDLIKIRSELTEFSDNPRQKYFKIRQSIVIPAKNDIPETSYTHLYIRKPDPYRAHVGDIDFILEPNKYLSLKQKLLDDKRIKGTRIFPRPELDMIELYDPDIYALVYIAMKQVTVEVRGEDSVQEKI